MHHTFTLNLKPSRKYINTELSNYFFRYLTFNTLSYIFFTIIGQRTSWNIIYLSLNKGKNIGYGLRNIYVVFPFRVDDNIRGIWLPSNISDRSHNNPNMKLGLSNLNFKKMKTTFLGEQSLYVVYDPLHLNIIELTLVSR